MIEAAGAQTRALGIDVGAERLHCVVLEAGGRIVDARVLRADDLDGVRALAATVSATAIDAPAAPSTAPHASDASLSAKFRPARCAEIGLGRLRRVWVPWVTPVAGPFPAWMAVGFTLFDAVRERPNVVETYPHAVFRTLAAGPVRPKRAADGIAARVALLEAAGVREPRLGMWSHDSLDAIAAAVAALGVLDGSAVGVTCGHDGSAIWLPEVRQA
jgi:predicted nuclease with RNAse H fold